ncbi:MAG: hypothetical protein ACOC1J_01905 [Prolixibacteraceae bacterium]
MFADKQGVQGFFASHISGGEKIRRILMFIENCDDSANATPGRGRMPDDVLFFYKHGIPLVSWIAPIRAGCKIKPFRARIWKSAPAGDGVRCTLAEEIRRISMFIENMMTGADATPAGVECRMMFFSINMGYRWYPGSLRFVPAAK